MDTKKTDQIVKDKVNKELLKRQTEIALKISNYAHYTALTLALIFKFILDFDGPLPYIFFAYFVVSQANTLLYKIHGEVVVVSLVFFTASYLSIFLIALFGGGLQSPFLAMIAVTTLASFISSLKHGRIFLGIGVLLFGFLLLDDIFNWAPDYEYTILQARYFAIFSYIFIFAIGSSAGSIIAKMSFRAYRLKKDLEKKTLEIEYQAGLLRESNEELNNTNEELHSTLDIVHRQKDKIEKAHKHITASINYASRIQSAVLSDTVLEEAQLEHFILFKPRDIVSGDFYWMKNTGKYIVVVTADCTGHGVPGAFMSMLGTAFLNEVVNKRNPKVPGEILNELRTKVKTSLKQTGKKGEAKDGMDMAIYSINIETNTLYFAGAHNPVFIIRKGKGFTGFENQTNMKTLESDKHILYDIKGSRQPVGIHLREKAFETNSIPLQAGDCLYTFSDGYVDQTGGKSGRKFMTKAFKKLLLNNCEKPMLEQKQILNTMLENWKIGHKQVDDILVVGLKIGVDLKKE